MAAGEALRLIQPGMVVGLGSGSTAAFFIQALGERVRQGLSVRGVPTSNDAADLAAALGIPLTQLEREDVIDIDVDGADEIDPDLNVLKGGGGALLHEKLVAYASRRLVIIADETKLVPVLGKSDIPVEVVAFGWTSTRRQIEGLGASCRVRGGEAQAFITDSGNMILDLSLPSGVDVFAFVERLKGLTGVVDHGVFQHMAAEAIVGNLKGSVQTLVPR